MMVKFLLLILPLVLLVSCRQQEDGGSLYQSESFTIYNDRVVQGDNVVEVISPTRIRSNYRSPASETFSRLVTFKFSINQKDNELPPGQNHRVIINDDQHESPIIKFGEKPGPVPAAPVTFLTPNYSYTFRVDVSPVLEQLEEKGYYETFDGIRIAAADFKGIYVAGGSEPLSWDFVNLDNKGLKLQPSDQPGIYTLTVNLNPYNEAEDRVRTWELSADISDRPHYTSGQPIVDALFNLSLEEALKNIEPDSTLRTGAKWGGVWTRDVSYSTLLAFAFHEPEVAKISLRRKVNRGRIIQDTGSGGAWPISSDRTTWCLAAWEIYKVTGDEAWLDEVYPIIKNTLEDDYKTLYDPVTGMYSGESSFLDWREQTYPKWMDNADIYVSENLGTNVVHYQAHRILAEMARIKGEPFEVYDRRAEQIKEGINMYLWMGDRGYYAQYLYGRNELIRSPRFEALGEALAILFEVTDEEKAVSILSRSPLTEFGVTCIYPQVPGIPPYHNNAIWPFVQSYWNLAAAKTGNETVLDHGLASVYRAAALFLTNYENMVAGTGDYRGTEINSDRMLWSIAGNMAMVFRVFIGMDFQTDGLHFNPVVPQAYIGDKTLSDFTYRDAVLNITVKGTGNRINTVVIDGEAAESAFFPASVSGSHEIIIELDNNDLPHKDINRVGNHFSLTTIQARKEDDLLKWDLLNGAVAYRIYKNGAFLWSTQETQWQTGDDLYVSFMVSAVDDNGYEGFACEPVVFADNVQIVEIEEFARASDRPYTNYSGGGFVELTLQTNRVINLTVMAGKTGTYLLDFRYANGSGPWNTDNKCAIRSLSVNDEYAGVIVMPQRGKDEWSDWGFTNARKVGLHKGINKVKIHFEDWNNNMNVEVNRAMLDYLRIIEVK